MSLSISQFMPPPSLSPVVTINLFSAPVTLFCFVNKFICIFLFLDSTFKQYPICVSLHLTQYDNLYDHHVAENDIISFFFMAEGYSTVYMCHIFFIHSSVDGHLGCFHVWAIINSVEMNTEVYVSFQIMFFSGYVSRSGISGSYADFLVLLILFST